MTTTKLLTGDCFDLLPTLPSKPDAIVTDPPYGLGKHLNGGSWGNAEKWDVRQNLAPLLDLAPIVAIWGGNYYALPPSRGWLVWYKPDAPPSMSDCELAWTNQDMNARHITHAIAATNVERVGHPTQKPLRVMRWTLEALNLPAGATVLDPFMGSGTTGVAAVRLGCNFIGIDIAPEYVALARTRIEAAQQQIPLFEVTTA